jgi:UPF0271 protein
MILNLDAGEGEPVELFKWAELASVACGGHTGDTVSMAQTLLHCRLNRLIVGAHPSFVDREHFGRRKLEVAPELLQKQVEEQCRALYRAARDFELDVVALKPHGALYHAADADFLIAEAVIKGASCALPDLKMVLGPHEGMLEKAAAGLEFWPECFADRGYGADGKLIARGQPGAMLGPVEAALQARCFKEAGFFKTICVHGDGPEVLKVLQAVREVLKE